jgi:hypothetical protein
MLPEIALRAPVERARERYASIGIHLGVSGLRVLETATCVRRTSTDFVKREGTHFPTTDSY